MDWHWISILIQDCLCCLDLQGLWVVVVIVNKFSWVSVSSIHLSSFSPLLSCSKNMVPFFNSAGNQEAHTGRRAGFCWRLATIEAFDPPEYSRQTGSEKISWKKTTCNMGERATGNEQTSWNVIDDNVEPLDPTPLNGSDKMLRFAFIWCFTTFFNCWYPASHVGFAPPRREGHMNWIIATWYVVSNYYRLIFIYPNPRVQENKSNNHFKKTNCCYLHALILSFWLSDWCFSGPSS